MRRAVCLVIAFILFLAPAISQVCLAKARVIAVIVFRSTAADHGDATRTAKALAQRLRQEPGWDSITVDAHGKSPADAAAAVGAEIYVIGQFFSGPPARVDGAAYRVATDERINEFSFTVSGATIPSRVTFSSIATRPQSIAAASAATAQTPPPLTRVDVPSGHLISVVLLSDIGSRISQEGDAFAVETVEDFYYDGHLILPKGSPGYGVISHIKRAGSFHAGGELEFTVKRLVTPSNTDVAVETNGATSDADQTTEHNGNTFGQYLLWGVGMFAKRGNDILIKKGTTFHVSTVQNVNVPIAATSVAPASLDPAYAVASGQPYIPHAAQPTAPEALPSPDARAAATYATKDLTVPQNWITEPVTQGQSSEVQMLGSWMDQSRMQSITLVSQALSQNTSAADYAERTVTSLRNSVGTQNVVAFRDARLCNNTGAGWYIETHTVSSGVPVIIEQTLAVGNTQAFIATYRRPSSAPEDAAAATALRSLCAT